MKILFVDNYPQQNVIFPKKNINKKKLHKNNEII